MGHDAQQHQPGGPIEVQGPGDGPQDRVGVAQVGVDVVGGALWSAGEQGTGRARGRGDHRLSGCVHTWTEWRTLEGCDRTAPCASGNVRRTDELDFDGQDTERFFFGAVDAADICQLLLAGAVGVDVGWSLCV
jgi:hypothetical protein